MISHNRSMLRYGVMGALTIAFGSPVATARSQASAPKLDDPTIVAIFDAANTYDMETGSLAVSKGHSKAVRDFGAMLVRDHRNVRQRVATSRSRSK
jgi:putative membrane protein